MNKPEFPLATFLTSLSAAGVRVTVRDYGRISLALQSGGPWTLPRLRDMLQALLVKDEDQQDTFQREFQTFFTLPPATSDPPPEIDLERALADLRTLARRPLPPSAPQPSTQHPPQSASPNPQSPISQLKWWHLAGALLILAMLISGVLWLMPLLRPPSPTETIVLEPTPVEATPIREVALPENDTPDPAPETRTRRYRNVPQIREITLHKTDPTWRWLPYAAGAAFFLFAAGLYGLVIWRKQQIPPDEPAAWDADKPRHFRLGSIGGRAAPWLDDETLNHLADSMGYFQNAEGGQQLDVYATLEGTMRRGGVPALRFHPRRELRSLLILVDEIDKAPRDFPNDLLHELNKMEFTITETGQQVTAEPHLAPLVFITSNSERRLPEPFLRRCVYHHIKFDDALVRQVVTARQTHDAFGRLGDDFIALAIGRFLSLRDRSLRKLPATGELLVWLQVLALAVETDPDELHRQLNGDLSDLPYLGVVLKDHQDIEELRSNQRLL